MFNNILVAFDGSDYAYRAARFAADMAGIIPGAKCTLITVLTFTREEARFLGATAEEFENAEKFLESKIWGEAKKLFSSTGVPLTVLFGEGDPAGEIVKFAGENSIDHIVIGSRGLGNIKGALLGSVSSKVIHNAKCPVTVVKDNY
jgi:Universal stress protein UspA and related nucleotide-binding proteins